MSQKDHFQSTESPEAGTEDTDKIMWDIGSYHTALITKIDHLQNEERQLLFLQGRNYI